MLMIQALLSRIIVAGKINFVNASLKRSLYHRFACVFAHWSDSSQILHQSDGSWSPRHDEPNNNLVNSEGFSVPLHGEAVIRGP